MTLNKVISILAEISTIKSLPAWARSDLSDAVTFLGELDTTKSEHVARLEGAEAVVKWHAEQGLGFRVESHDMMKQVAADIVARLEKESK